MTPDQASVIKDFLIPQIEMEIACTAKLIAAVPAERKDYTPDAKSMTAEGLAEHLLASDPWFLQGVVAGEFGGFPEPSGAQPAEMAAMYTERVTALLEQIKGLSGEHMAKPVKFHTWEMPNVNYLEIMQKHSVHHRGQLSAYLRPMGAKVPSIYGSSADEPFTATAGEGN